MGRTASERERLDLQGRVFAPHSENLFRQAGIGAGDRVLDVGCGSGDTTCLLGEIVGPTGSVIGVDRDSASLDMARERARRAHLRNVEFHEQELSQLELDGPVDAIAGRLILIHLPDPAAVIADVSRWVKPGGVVTFQEITCHRARAIPSLPAMEDWIRWASAGLRQAGADPDIGERLPEILHRAGAVDIGAVSVSIAGDGSGAIPTYLAQTVQSLSPMILAAGVASSHQLAELEGMLREQSRDLNAMLYIQDLAAVWGRTLGA
jgi:SAM-dependent methyltransferase